MSDHRRLGLPLTDAVAVLFDLPRRQTGHAEEFAQVELESMECLAFAKGSSHQKAKHHSSCAAYSDPCCSCVVLLT